MTAANVQEDSAVRQPFAATGYPEDPYPGARPDCSFVQLDGMCYPLVPDTTAPSGWRVCDDEPERPCLDHWLIRHGAAPLSDRRPVLSYGSNVCPEKITWLRSRLDLAGPAVLLRAECTGAVAAWSAGLRPRDGQRPAVLAAAPGVTEQHAVWMATAEQRRVLDRCEGRGRRYRLVRLGDSTRIRLENGEHPGRVLAYSSATREMAPMLVGGDIVRCAEMDQHRARRLAGVAAFGDGLACTEILGEPSPT